MASGKAGAIKLMIMHTSIIKRPIIESGNHLLVGYKRRQLYQTPKTINMKRHATAVWNGSGKEGKGHLVHKAPPG